LLRLKNPNPERRGKMKEKKANARKGQGGFESSTNQNKRKNIDCWHNIYKRQIDRLSEEQKNMLETYRDSALTGITKITQSCCLEELENWENTKESFSYEIITQRLQQFLSGEFSVAQTVQLAKKLTLRRQGSWFLALIRQRENLQIFPQEFILEWDEEDGVHDVGAGQSEWTPPLAPLDPYRTDPEACLLRVEEMEHVEKLPEMVGKCGKEWASLYQRILEFQLSGEDVGPRHRERLGVETDKKLREFKWQAKREAEEKSVEVFPDLEERQKVYREQRGKEWKVEKSTGAERRRLYRDPYKAQFQPSPVKHIPVVNGVPTIPLDTLSSSQPNIRATSLGKGA
jgi:hypothetical protein